MEALTSQLKHEILTQAEDEGEPALLTATQIQGADLPRHWPEVALSETPGAAAADLLWAPLETSLPRTVEAIRFRLAQVLVLRTRAVPASLLYVFRDGQDVFIYRGLPPLAVQPGERMPIPKECYDFYAVHDGWTLFFSEEDGLLPYAELYPLSEWLGDRGLELPPFRTDPEQLLVAFESSPTYVLAFDTTKDSLCVRVWDDGSVEIVPDFISELDEEYGEFLEQLERTA